MTGSLSAWLPILPFKFHRIISALTCQVLEDFVFRLHFGFMENLLAISCPVLLVLYILLPCWLKVWCKYSCCQVRHCRRVTHREGPRVCGQQQEVNKLSLADGTIIRICTVDKCFFNDLCNMCRMFCISNSESRRPHSACEI